MSKKRTDDGTDDFDVSSYSTLLEKLLAQLQRLPGPLRRKMEQQIKELMSLVRDHRPPRFMLIGRRGAGKSTLLNAICSAKVAEIGPVVDPNLPTRCRMQIARAELLMLALLLMSAVASTAPVVAQDCGDADSNGRVSVTDGVAMLRASADLPARCPRRRCDMNLDGKITVTDAVGALRLAAGLDAQAQCSQAQVDNLFGQLVKTTGLANASATGASVTGAQTIPCPDGGFTEDDGNLTRFVDCRDGDVTTNGTIQVRDVGTDRQAVDYSLSDAYASTGEAIQTTGTLTFAIFDTTTVVNGLLAETSTLVGSSSSDFRDVFLDANGDIEGGQILLSVIDGRNAFVNLREVEFNIYSTTVFQAVIVYTDDDFETYIFGDAVCASCTQRLPCEDPTTVCVPCLEGCTGEETRCSVDFGAVDCEDGLFGPTDLCAPCTQDTDCSLNLICEPCSSECTGSIRRCASPTAFAECEDGWF